MKYFRKHKLRKEKQIRQETKINVSKKNIKQNEQQCNRKKGSKIEKRI